MGEMGKTAGREGTEQRGRELGGEGKRKDMERGGIGTRREEDTAGGRGKAEGGNGRDGDGKGGGTGSEGKEGREEQRDGTCERAGTIHDRKYNHRSSRTAIDLQMFTDVVC